MLSAAFEILKQQARGLFQPKILPKKKPQHPVTLADATELTPAEPEKPLSTSQHMNLASLPTPAHATRTGGGSFWPLDKFQAALQPWLGEPPKLGFAVLLTTGAMNPVHLGHIQ